LKYCSLVGYQRALADLKVIIPSFFKLIFIKKTPGQIFSSAYWRDDAFNRLWTMIGPIAAKRQPELEVALANISGVVVDIGTGT
jgi:hypothetical protein